MLTTISWTDYVITVALLLVIYYGYIALRYYRREIKNLLTGKSKKSNPLTIDQQEHLSFPGNAFSFAADEASIPVLETAISKADYEETPDNSYLQFDQLLEKLKAAIYDASKRKFVRQELLQYFKLVVREHPDLNNAQFQPLVSEFIFSECEKYSSITLSEEEIETLWHE